MRTRNLHSKHGHPRKRRQRVTIHKPPVGSAPGTLATPHKTAQMKIRLLAYDENHVVEQEVNDISQIHEWIGRYRVLWIDIQGLADQEALRQLAGHFNLHALTLEDIVHVHQRPKVESYENQLFIVTRIPNPGDGLLTEQVSMVLGENHIITFQERSSDCFDAVRKRITAGKGRIRHYNADYLAYALVDAATDAFFPLLENYGETIEALENTITRSVEQAPVHDLHKLKRDLFELRRAIWPLRDMIGALSRDDSGFISETLHTYLRDCQDHATQLLDIVETYRDVTSGLMELYLSSINLRMNEIMKVLTIIATVFIPLSFIASLYGMNFNTGISPFNMPELNWYLGYPIALLLMAAVAIGLLVFFYRRDWIKFKRRGTD